MIPFNLLSYNEQFIFCSKPTHTNSGAVLKSITQTLFCQMFTSILLPRSHCIDFVVAGGLSKFSWTFLRCRRSQWHKIVVRTTSASTVFGDQKSHGRNQDDRHGEVKWSVNEINMSANAIYDTTCIIWTYLYQTTILGKVLLLHKGNQLERKLVPQSTRKKKNRLTGQALSRTGQPMCQFSYRHSHTVLTASNKYTLQRRTTWAIKSIPVFDVEWKCQGEICLEGDDELWTRKLFNLSIASMTKHKLPFVVKFFEHSPFLYKRAPLTLFTTEECLDISHFRVQNENFPVVYSFARSRLHDSWARAHFCPAVIDQLR